MPTSTSAAWSRRVTTTRSFPRRAAQCSAVKSSLSSCSVSAPPSIKEATTPSCLYVRHNGRSFEKKKERERESQQHGRKEARKPSWTAQRAPRRHILTFSFFFCNNDKTPAVYIQTEILYKTPRGLLLQTLSLPLYVRTVTPETS